MARGRGSKPTHYIAVTAKVGKGRYEKGPYIGLWEGDDDDRGPLFRGSVQGKYLDELYDFIKDYGSDAISFGVFESRGDRGNRRNRDEDNEDQPPRGRRSSRGRSSSRDERDDDRRSSRGRGRGKDEREDEKEDRGSSRRGSGRGSKKDSDWWDD